MATREMRNYGNLGGDGTQSAATDQATWRDALAASAAGDTIHVGFVAGKRIIKPPTTLAQLRKSNVDFAFDEGIELWPQVGHNEFLNFGGLSNMLWHGGDTNGFYSDPPGPMSRNGKWGIQLNRRKNPQIGGGCVVSRFAGSSGISIEDWWIESMRETLANGKCTEYCSSAPCFAYNAPTQAVAPDDITLRNGVGLGMTYGYGLMQACGAKTIRFYNLAQDGGSLLRPEQDCGPETWRRIDRLIADNIYLQYGNCTVQLNPHTNKVRPLGTHYEITDITSNCNERVYLIDDPPGDYMDGWIDGIAAYGGPGAMNAVQIPGQTAQYSNTTTDGRTSQAWKYGPSHEFASARTDSIVENARNQVRNVVYFGSFPQGRGIPTGADVKEYGTLAGLKGDARWEAGFESDPPPTTTPKDVDGGIAPSGVPTLTYIPKPPPTPKDVTGAVAPSGEPTLTKVVGQVPAPAEWVTRPIGDDPHPSAFLQAKTDVPRTYVWTVDGVQVLGAAGVTVDSLSIPTPLGAHTVSLVVRDTDGKTSQPILATWTTVQEEPPPPPVEPPVEPPPIPGLLACGYHTAYLAPRGGGMRLGRIPHTSLTYKATESDTNECTITIDSVSRFGGDCCHLLDTMQEWVHEVEVRRNGPVAFIGPVTKIRTAGDTATITASDMSAWFSRRRIHKPHSWLKADLCTIARDCITDAMATDRTPKLSTVIDAPSGIIVDFSIPVGDVQLLSELMRELVQLGLVWSVQGRVIHLGFPGQPTMPVLIDEAFTDDPAILTSGDGDVNDVVATGNDQGDSPTIVVGSSTNPTDAALRGRLEGVIDAGELTAKADGDALARRAVDDGVNGQRVVEAGVLAASAPISFAQCAPLHRVRLSVSGCRPVNAAYRVTSRSVTEGRDGDQVTIGVDPL